jgi:hypothetical protein
MKIKNLLIAIMSVLSVNAYGQNALYGTWTAHCSYEANGGGKSIKTSNLCPLEMTSDSSLEISSFTLKVDSTHLSFGDSKKRIPYVKRPSGNAITFVKDRQPFGFDVVGTTSSDFIILRSKNGQMLLLEKQKLEE